MFLLTSRKIACLQEMMVNIVIKTENASKYFLSILCEIILKIIDKGTM